MLTIRLSRIGKRKQPTYRLIISEKKKDTFGDYLELLGNFNPRTKEVNLKVDRIKYWLGVGAQTSNTVHNILVKEGVIDEGKKKKSVKISKKRRAKKDKAKEESKPEKKEEVKEPKAEGQEAVKSEDATKEESKSNEKPKEETKEVAKEEVKPDEKPEEKKEEPKKEEESKPEEEKK